MFIKINVDEMKVVRFAADDVTTVATLTYTITATIGLFVLRAQVITNSETDNSFNLKPKNRQGRPRRFFVQILAISRAVWYN